MKYFYDTEFIEDGKTIDLISIGIIAEDGREFYAINRHCHFQKASNWVQENVLQPMGIEKDIPYLAKQALVGLDATSRSKIHLYKTKTEPYLMGKILIKNKILEFCNPNKYGNPEFWGYYSDYDHVVLCQIFGTMMDLPENFPMYTKDLKQLVDQYNIKNLPPQQDEHNALEDAKWNKLLFEWIQKEIISNATT